MTSELVKLLFFIVELTKNLKLILYLCLFSLLISCKNASHAALIETVSLKAFQLPNLK